MTATHEIRLTESDVARLERALLELLQRSDEEPHGAAELETLLDSAAIVPSARIDSQVVTMNSTVVLEARPSLARTTLTLVYPKDADMERARVSVLSPVGRKLLGARVGDSLRVIVPGHGEREFRVAELPFQPEAHGRFDL